MVKGNIALGKTRISAIRVILVLSGFSLYLAHSLKSDSNTGIYLREILNTQQFVNEIFPKSYTRVMAL